MKEQLAGLKQNALPATHNTIPIIYHKDVFIGGFSDLVAALKVSERDISIRQD